MTFCWPRLDEFVLLNSFSEQMEFPFFAIKILSKNVCTETTTVGDFRTTNITVIAEADSLHKYKFLQGQFVLPSVNRFLWLYAALIERDFLWKMIG